MVGAASAVDDYQLTQLAGLRDRLGTLSVAEAIGNDALNTAFDPTLNRLLVLRADELIAVQVGAAPGSATIERFDVSRFGVAGARGMSVDPVSGALYIVHGHAARLIHIEPGMDRGFADASVTLLDLAGQGLGALRGIAFNPGDGHLHVLEPEHQLLHELTTRGRLVTTRNLSAFHLGEPQGMVFAPSGDLTDAASEMSLYIADRGAWHPSGTLAGGVIEISFIRPPRPEAASTSNGLRRVMFTGPVTLANVTNTSQYNPPSPDPSGIGYIGNGRLLISDGEVNEMPIYTGFNLFEINLSGSLVNISTSDPAFSEEPTGVSGVNPSNNAIYISDDTDREISQVIPGPDGRYGTGDDIVTEFSTRDFSPESADPEGVAYAPALGDLFVADGVNNEIYRVSPGANGIFDGPPAGGGDDVVTSFDTESVGLMDPEGIEYDNSDGTLLAGGDPNDLLFQFSVTGTLLSTIDISEAVSAGLRRVSGLAIAPSSQAPATNTSVYIVDRAVDNDSDPNENDGRLFEMLGSSGPPVNRPPFVDAGPDQAITLPDDGVTLNGAVLDDGLPTTAVITTWGQESGPGVVTFADAGEVDTTASFPIDGTYVLRLTADDSELTAFDELTVTVNPEPVNQAPNVAAGPDQTITLPDNALLDGTVNDDGLPDPPDTTTVTWSQVSGPGAVVFGNANAVDTAASFPLAGTYVLRLMADDSELTAFAELTVTVNPQPPNQAPTVNAGPDRTIALPGIA
ncbi:MAG: hypothetical protein OEN20_10080, partial [Gammaproteobacteria bacterium]|nr:hypothetical protein [Gammaproteobacteria bacterium]